MEDCFVLRPLPLRNSSLALHFASKILTPKTHLPLGISMGWVWIFSGSTAHYFAFARKLTKLQSSIVLGGIQVS